jgi:hypothetical protein
MPELVKLLMTRPRTVLLPAVISRPMTFGPALPPVSSIRGEPA